jgi:hypothetical protein
MRDIGERKKKNERNEEKICLPHQRMCDTNLSSIYLCAFVRGIQGGFGFGFS